MSTEKKKCQYCNKIIDAQAIEALHGDPDLLGSVVPLGHMVASGFGAIASNQSVAATSRSAAVGGDVHGDVIVGGETPKRPFLAPPSPNYELIGRDNLLRDLKQRLFLKANLAESPFADCPRITSPFCPYFLGEKGDVISQLALVGLPGVGKTALAVELAHDLYVRKYFTDGVLWARLGRKPDISAELTRWSTALGIPSEEMAKLETIGAKVDKVRQAIGKRRMLLVIDDAWEVKAALAFELGGPNCAHILTTRFPQIARRFAGTEKVVPELDHNNGFKLLKQLAPQAVKAEPEEAEKLVQGVGGLPLGLILIGNYLNIEGSNKRRIGEALEKLNRMQERLLLAQEQRPIEGHPSLPEGASISLDAIIAVSYEALDDEAPRRTLRALSILRPKPNTFSEEAALAIVNESVKALDKLSDYGLLEQRKKDERYQLHQTIADYATSNRNEDETSLFEQRAATYFAAYAQKHSRSGYKEFLDQDWLNISHSMEWAYKHKQWQTWLDGVQGLTAHNLGVVGFMDARGYWSNARELLEKALERAKALNDPLLEASILTKMGAFAFRQAEFDTAKKYSQAAETILAQLPFSTDVAMQRAHVYEFMFGLQMMQRNPREALKRVQQARTVLKDIQTNEATHQKGYLYILSAMIRGRAGQSQKAIEEVNQGLALLPSAPTSAKIIGLMIRSNVYAELGNIGKSIESQNEAIQIAQKLNDSRRLATLWINKGLNEANCGNQQAAIDSTTEAFELYQKMGSFEGQALAHANLGLFYIVLGDDDLAKDHITQAVGLSEQYRLLDLEALAKTTLANLLIYQKKFPDATEALIRAEKICKQLGLADSLLGVLYWQAEMARLEGKYDQGLKLVQKLMQVGKGDGYLLQKGMAWSVKGQILDGMRRFEHAEAAHQASLRFFAGQYPYERAQSQRAFAAHFIMRDGVLSDRAKSLLEEALKTFNEIGAKREITLTKALLDG